jgi:glycosyltransferase involved in cell wall biosynthesis
MRIAFWGLQGSFDYHHIGGMDSLTRRLGVELAQRGMNVDFVHFGASERRSEEVRDGLRLHYYREFANSLSALRRYDHVVTIYIPPKERIAYAHFRQREADHTRFHLIYAGWPESWIKRQLLFIEARLRPYNGYLFCISPRQYRCVSKWCGRTHLLMPPVPENYFLNPEERPKRGILHVAYMGRIDPSKGTGTAIALLRHLAKKPKIETGIYGYHWEHKLESVQLHKQLLSQEDIIYEPTKFKGYSTRVDVKVRKILHNADVLLLPYQRLSSTIDMPLLLLEGMASLCAVLTKPLGSIAEIYGTDQWMLDDFANFGQVERLLRRLGRELDQEQSRLKKQDCTLKFSTPEVVDEFREILQNA